MAPRPIVLFLCTGNSCRSQMAEGFANALHGELLEARSAGITAHGLNACAVTAMNEVGIDITSHRSEVLRAEDLPGIDLVVTVCDHAGANCPVLPNARSVVHRSFEDPPRLAREAEAAGSTEEEMVHYRRVREEIRSFIEKELPGLLALQA